MEATLVARPTYRATDLLSPDFAVPTNQPTLHSRQPRVDSDHRTRKFLKSIPRISLRPVRSVDSASELGRSKSRSNKPLNGSRRPQSSSNNGDLAHQTDQSALGGTCATTHEDLQSNGAPQELDQDDVRIPKLKLLFWKMMRPQKLPSITDRPVPEGNVASIVSDPEAQPTIIITEDNNPPVAIDPNPVVNATTIPAPSVRSQATIASPESSITPYALPADLSSSIEWAPSLHPSTVQAQVPPTAVTPESCSPFVTTSEATPSGLVVKGQNLPTRDREIGIVDEAIGSTKMYSPEQGIFVGKLYELPPPDKLQLNWRQNIRPQLVKNLRTVIASLPQSLTRADTTIEPELIMSGVSSHGHSTVTLAPTIWIRCGSKQCRKAVQQAVADLSHVQRFPVHVTLHAPRPASAGQAPESLSRTLEPYLEDEILPFEPDRSPRPATVYKMPFDTPLPDHISLRIRVQSLVENKHSACGLRVQFSFPNGMSYTSTLGGLVLLGDAVVGLTTAHAIFDRPEYDSLPELRGSDSTCVSKTEFAVPAKLRAAKFGSLYIQPESDTAHVFSNIENNHDFALLQLDAKDSAIARNIYQASRGHQVVDTVSRDLRARAVQVVCSSEDVKPGHLIDGDSIIIDETGYWETRKIQLETPLGKSHSQSSTSSKISKLT
jgi:hypothetical protein